MTNPMQITKWVIDYRAAGSEALKSKKKGRKRTMNKEKIIREIEDGNSRNSKSFLSNYRKKI